MNKAIDRSQIKDPKLEALLASKAFFHYLCWNNPYGVGMLHGKIETRPRPTKVRGWVLITTAKKPMSDKDVDNISGLSLRANLEHVIGADPLRNAHGYAIGIGNLTDSRLMLPEDEEKTFVKYRPDFTRYCWEFTEIFHIEPFVWKHGKQGWGFVPNSELPSIKLL